MRGNPWYAAAAELAAGDPVASGEQLREVTRALVLLGLEAGATRPAELPRAWPVTRVAIRAAVADAIAAGLCATDGTPRGTLRLTARGHSVLAGMRARRVAA